MRRATFCCASFGCLSVAPLRVSRSLWPREPVYCKGGLFKRVCHCALMQVQIILRCAGTARHSLSPRWRRRHRVSHTTTERTLVMELYLRALGCYFDPRLIPVPGGPRATRRFAGAGGCSTFFSASIPLVPGTSSERTPFCRYNTRLPRSCSTAAGGTEQREDRGPAVNRSRGRCKLQHRRNSRAAQSAARVTGAKKPTVFRRCSHKPPSGKRCASQHKQTSWQTAKSKRDGAFAHRAEAAQASMHGWHHPNALAERRRRRRAVPNRRSDRGPLRGGAGRRHQHSWSQMLRATRRHDRGRKSARWTACRRDRLCRGSHRRRSLRRETQTTLGAAVEPIEEEEEETVAAAGRFLAATAWAVPHNVRKQRLQDTTGKQMPGLNLSRLASVTGRPASNQLQAVAHSIAADRTQDRPPIGTSTC